MFKTHDIFGKLSIKTLYLTKISNSLLKLLLHQFETIKTVYTIVIINLAHKTL